MVLWEKAFETNISDVDDQHRHLLKLINDLNDEVVAQLEYDNYDKIMEILNELSQYTIDHFKYEEKMMKDKMGALNDEALAEFWAYFKLQRTEHAAFVSKIQQLLNQDIDDQQEDISLDLVNFLVEWLKNHILVIDLQLSKYLNL